MMAEQEIKGAYDARQGAEKEAAHDAKQIRSAFEHDGAELAVLRLQAEVDAVPATQRQAYGAVLLKNLQGDGNNANLLPEIALAFGNAHQDRVSQGGYVSRDCIASAVQNEKNSVYAEMYRQFSDKFKYLRHEKQNQSWVYGDNSMSPAFLNEARHWLGDKLNDKVGADWGSGVSVAELSRKVSEEAAKIGKRNKDREDLGLLAEKPELFDYIAQNDGQISRSDAQAFREKLLLASGDEGLRFRERFGKTASEQERLTRVAGALLDTFENKDNEDGKPGSVLEDGYDFYGWNPLSGDYMTRDSLARGLGYSSPQEAQKRLPHDSRLHKDQVDTNPDVQSANDFSQTAQRRGDGPWQVAEHMLAGQGQYFQEPSQAQKLLTDVLRHNQFWTRDRQGEPKLTPENRNDVLAAVKAAEVKHAEQSGVAENNDLSRWFAARYPELLQSKPHQKGEVEPLLDFSNTRLRGKKDGPRAVASRMIHGQEEFFSDPHKAVSDLSRAIGVRGGIHNNRKGAEQVTSRNIDKIIENIEKTGNQELLDWFKKRYPKH
ncbi:MAG: hypothetical protein C0507_15455 [Cyanobacteria bacterium PR.3.49]|nr:hypothetical protein [Cyanobacteria bacterium PR.3.49]